MFTKLFNVFVGSPACGGGYGNYGKNEIKLPLLLILRNKQKKNNITTQIYVSIFKQIARIRVH